MHKVFRQETFELNRIMLKRIILIAIFGLSCSVNYAQSDVVGYYVGRETHRTINLYKDGSYNILYDRRDIPLVFKMDTLSFGNWKLEDNLIVLNSSEKIKKSCLKVLVQEEIIENFDSILIEIHNPYEDKYFSNCGKHPRVFTYSMCISAYSDVYGPEINLKDNKICLKKYMNNDLVNLNIFIIPNVYYLVSPIAFNYLETEEYIFKNRKSNKIIVTIPPLSGGCKNKNDWVGRSAVPPSTYSSRSAF